MTESKNYAFDVALGILLVAILTTTIVATRRDDIPRAGVVFVEAQAQSLLMTAGPSHLTIDSVTVSDRQSTTPGGNPARLTVRSGEILKFDGWATDDAASAAAGGVLIQVDGSDRIEAGYGGSRPDVAASLKMPAAMHSAFEAVVPAKLLPRGDHVLSFLVLTEDLQRYYWYPARVLVHVERGASR